MSKRALAGGYGPAQKDGRKRPRGKASQTPLDFALAVMRDETQTPALRAAMAKAALPYLHTRGEAPEDDDVPAEGPMSDLELARRIAHILARGKEQVEREAAETQAKRSEGEAVASGAALGAEFRTATAVPQRSPSADAQPRMAWPDDDAAQGREIFPDPHAGYRWIR